MITAVALLLFLVLAATSCGGSPAPQPTPTPHPTPILPSPTPTPTPPTPTPSLQPTLGPPRRDLMDLARRFRGLPDDAPQLARRAPFSYQLGAQEDFFVLDLETPALLQVSATLRLVTQHAYFFVADDVQVSQSTLERIGADFEGVVYPTVTDVFGREWSPGIDSDPHITVLFAHLRGAGGYFTAVDEFPLRAAPGSNEREMLYLDASTLSSSRAAYNALMAHELQHLVHWNVDPDEEAWVNEGLAQLAAELVGAGTKRIQAFLSAPETQLNYWPPPTEDAWPHYAASQLFFRYLLDRFGGREHAGELAAIAADGVAGVEEYLRGFGMTFEDVFADWVVANYLDAPEGPYAHQGADLRVALVDVIRGPGEGDGSVPQFAADYLKVEPPAGGGLFRFDGAEEVGIGVPPRDGAFWWSGRGDSIDSRLTRSFDLRGLQRATLRFWTWFDIERGWDYAYVAVSLDGGRTWQALPGRHTTEFNPVGAAYGPGYTGTSGGEEPSWVQEEIDLTPFVGHEILLRFEYVTDDSAHTIGLALDDIEIPELGFRDGGGDAEGWTAEGFRLIRGPLPQRFIVQVIREGRVERVSLDAANRAEVPLSGPATIIIAAVTQGTAEPATYRWSLTAGR